MKKIFSHSRRVRVPVPGDQYNSVEYFDSVTVEYDENDLEENTIIDSNEFKELSEIVDREQRKIIKREMGITELPMDKTPQEKVKKKFKFKR